MNFDSYYEQRWSPILVTPDTWHDKSMFEVYEITDGICLSCFAPVGWVNGEWLAFYITDEDGENAVCPTCFESFYYGNDDDTQDLDTDSITN